MTQNYRWGERGRGLPLTVSLNVTYSELYQGVLCSFLQKLIYYIISGAFRLFMREHNTEKQVFFIPNESLYILHISLG